VREGKVSKMDDEKPPIITRRRPTGERRETRCCSEKSCAAPWSKSRHPRRPSPEVLRPRDQWCPFARGSPSRSRCCAADRTLR